MLSKLVSEVMNVDVFSCDVYPDPSASFFGTGWFISMTLTNGKGRAINFAEFAFKSKLWLRETHKLDILTYQDSNGLFKGFTIDDDWCFPISPKGIEDNGQLGRTEYELIVNICKLYVKKEETND